MAFPEDPLGVVVELQLGGSWMDITPHVYARDPIKIERGRRDEGSRADPAVCTLTINNRDGRYSPRNPRSPYYGLLGRNSPVRVYVLLPGGVSYRFVGEVSAWPSRWAPSGADVWIPVQAAGILRRLGQGAQPLRDALRRHIEASVPRPLAYWPLTDGEYAIQGSEVISGAQPARTLGPAGSYYQGQVEWGKGELAPWMDAAVGLPPASRGNLTVGVNPAPAATDGWSVDIVRSGLGSQLVVEMWDTAPRISLDPQICWSLVVGIDGDTSMRLVLGAYDEASSSSMTLALVNVPALYTPGPHHIRLTVTPAPGDDAAWSVMLDGAVVASGVTWPLVRPLAKINTYWVTVTGDGGDTGPLAIGHLTYWGPQTPPAADTWRAVRGHAGERAGRRIERLCAEQGVPLQVTGSLDDTPAMGPQRPATFLDLLATAEDVDGGTLGEARDELALAYRTRTSRYNQGG
ncbi:hypothetical protein [Streptomyces sp. Z26]|uniref:hypothetical protein n=1 Tax=Streptomyces sp. Z26 TaxID=2500177 RepID=UPI000FCAE5DE|nr:hypothetical protein [Streptomyces sp. Z26]